MARAFYPPRPETVSASQVSYYHAASDRHYTLERRDNRFFLRRYQAGYGSAQTNVVEKEIHYVMGSGRHARTFLHRTGDGRLLELPVAWYAEKGGLFAMNPGYDRADHDDFRRRITYECMFCHNGYPEIAPGADLAGSDPLFPGKLPAGIDCQRCHGPGRSHVRAVESGKPVEQVRAAVVNPRRLSRERQLEVCMQCHLESTSFRLPHSLRQVGRGVFSYRPGEPLADYILHFDHPPGAGYDDKFEIAHQAWRLRKSACFQKSALTCTTCHNPHDVPRGAPAEQHYTQVCRSCHDAALVKLAAAGRHTADPGCLGCHMPKRRTDDVVHVVMTDHFTQRRRPARDLTAPLRERHDTRETAYTGEVAPYYPSPPPSTPASELLAAVAQVKQNTNLKGGIPRLEAAIARHRPAQAEYSFELAEAYWNSGEAEKGFEWYEQALQRNPEFWPALYGYGTALAKTGRHDRAIALLERAVAAMPQSAASRAHLGLALLEAGRVDEAATALGEAVARDPDVPEAHNTLGGALLRKGDAAAAESAFREAIRVQPDYAEAHKNLADVLLARGEVRQARWHLERAVRYEPDYAEAYVALGDALAMENNVPAAIEQYRKAVAARPGLAAAQFNLGAALAGLGRRSEARQHLSEAVRLEPRNLEAQLNLGLLLAGEGRRREAEPHLRAAGRSRDPQIRDAALAALR